MSVSVLRLSFGPLVLGAAMTFSFFFGAVARAEPLADTAPPIASPAAPAQARLEAVLARLESEPIRAKVQVRVSHRGAALLSGGAGVRRANVNIEDGPRGVRIGWQLDKPSAGWRWSAWPWRAAISRNEDEPILSSQEAAALLDYRPILEEWLGRATLLEEGADSHHGREAWKLVFRLDPPEDADWRSEIPADAPLVYEDVATVWIDEEGTPLAVARKSRFDFGHLVSGESEETRELQLAHGRLVTVEGEQMSLASGLKVFRGRDQKSWRVTLR